MKPPSKECSISVTVNTALLELGLSERYFLRVLKLSGFKLPRAQSKNFNYGRLDIVVWMVVCRLLHLPFDSLSYGYSKRIHLCRVGRAIQDGTYILPRTKALELLFRHYLELERSNIRFEKNHLGKRLQGRVRANRFNDVIKRRRVRKANLVRFAGIRRELWRLWIKNEINAPSFGLKINQENEEFTAHFMPELMHDWMESYASMKDASRLCDPLR